MKAEISALDEMIEHIRYQMESSPTEKEIWESARRFALSQQKFFAAVNTINEENTDSREYYDVLATHYKRMYLTLGIL